MKLAYKLFALILSVSAFALILSSCAATEDTAVRLSPLEQALADAVTVALRPATTDLELATAVLPSTPPIPQAPSPLTGITLMPAHPFAL